MNIGSFDTNKEVMIVAEIGNNHEGSYALAEEMIYKAAQAGADAVKFQTLRADSIVSRSDTKRYEQLKSFELTFDEFTRLSETANKAGLIFFSTPFDLESVRFLNSIVPAFKIASGDNTFYPLIAEISETGKPIIMSTGLSAFDQIVSTKNFIEQIWNKNGIQQEMALLHCVASYPVPLDQTNLRAIGNLKAEFNCVVGYSDHTVGIEAAVLSVALGARIIEKHFTLDKNFSDFADHRLSADPTELSELVRRVRQALMQMGDGSIDVMDCEKAAVQKLRRSIVASRDLTPGSRISSEDITWVRPGGGLPPGSEQEILNKILNEPIRQGQMMEIHNVCENVRR